MILLQGVAGLSEAVYGFRGFTRLSNGCNRFSLGFYQDLFEKLFGGFRRAVKRLSKLADAW